MNIFRLNSNLYCLLAFKLRIKPDSFSYNPGFKGYTHLCVSLTEKINRTSAFEMLRKISIGLFLRNIVKKALDFFDDIV